MKKKLKLFTSKRHALVVLATAVMWLWHGAQVGSAQTTSAMKHDATAPNGIQMPADEPSSLGRYVDSVNGMTVTEAVAYALRHNGELMAARAEVDAARARLGQAQLRPNPQLDVSRSEQIGGTDNNTMIGASLPLELGGRRAARVHVAERELEVRELLLQDRERQLAAQVRAEFGTALAEARKLRFVEELLGLNRRNYTLVSARVSEGRTAPLEQNMVLVEVNRIRSLREAAEGRVEVAMLTLRNALGMQPEEPLRLRGELSEPPLVFSVAVATERALRERPDLLAARAAEGVAAAQVEQARAEGRYDASLMAQYERMNFGFPIRGINDRGQLAPVQGTFNMVTVGVSVNLPVRNKNQGAIEAALAEARAAEARREFLELTIRREVAAAYARRDRATRALEIYHAGVRGRASQNLDVIRQTYELGAKTLLDYIAEQRRFVEVENGYVDALLDTYLARVETERVTASPELAAK